jgi:hypothetical protein
MRIRPLLSKNCFPCHTGSRMGGLQVDSREHLLRGGKDGPALIPYHPKESLLIQAVSHSRETLKMPPQGKLKEEDIEALSAWVKQGAVWPTANLVEATAGPKGEYVIRPDQRAFWAFQPVRNPSIPQVRDQSWAKNNIDRFVLAKLDEKGLKPVRPTDKRALIRRATFDLIGLPPTLEEVDAFVADKSPGAFAKVVDRLLASTHYGERWGRYWLDYARYADEKFTRGDSRYANSFRYRDWVVKAFNDDMPYDLFVKAQIAGDLLDRPDRDKLIPALGFYALSPEGEDQEDRVDVTSRTFLALTVACARCHDHKYDPIPTKDHYSLLGVFRSSPYNEVPLASADVVAHWKESKKTIEDQKSAINDFIEKQSSQLAELLAAQTSSYMVAAWKAMRSTTAEDTAALDPALDRETLDRWIKYLKNPEKEHAFLKHWYDLMAHRPTEQQVRKAADEFQSFVLSVNAEKRELDDRNYVALGGARGAKDTNKRQYTNIETLEIKKYYLWRDLASPPYSIEFVKFEGGIYYYGPKQIDRWLSGTWKRHLESMRAQLTVLEKALPPQYPFLHAIKDSDKPANAKVEIRGEADNLGEEAPRRFLRILAKEEPAPFKHGSGRLELAEAIASPDNPLTARVMVNRLWQYHFGQGIVRTPSNFGQLGDRPSHPELLDYLAARFVKNGWSMKALHREMMLSATYALSAEQTPVNVAQDPDNRLFWRANIRRRLDVEALRDSILAVSGDLDPAVGGSAAPLNDDNRRRTLYGLVSRNKLDPTLALFDFPDPNNTSEQRMVTTGPLQRLFFMNSSFLARQAEHLAARLKADAPDDAARIARAYRLLYGREPEEKEIQMGLKFLENAQGAWQQYAQMLLSSAEFSSVN